MKNCELLLIRFGKIQSIKLQKERPVDLDQIRKFQPLVERGMPLNKIGKKAADELEKNKQNLYLLSEKLFCAIIKKIKSKRKKLPNDEEINGFVSSLCGIIKKKDFPFYGPSINRYLDQNGHFPQLFSKSDRMVVKRFLTDFQNYLNGLLVNSAYLVDIDGENQETHILFHSMLAINLIFKSYLEFHKTIDLEKTK